MTGAGFSLFLAAALLGHAVQAKLPSATWGRTSAASVVTGDQWLLIGGSFRTFTTTAPGNAGYQQAREHLASTIAILDLERKRVRDEFVDPSPDGVNRMNSTGHSCAYSKSEETVYCFGGLTIANDNNARALLPGIGVLKLNGLVWESGTTTGMPLRAGHSSIQLGSDWYIFGGRGGNSLLADLWKITLPGLEEEQVKFSGPGPSGRSWACTAALNESSFIMLGGIDSESKPIAEAWIYDADQVQWRDVTKQLSAASLPLDRMGGACATVKGKVMMYGGMDASNTIQNDLWSIDVNTLAVKEEATQLTRRSLSRIYPRQDTAGVPGIRVFPQVASLNKYMGLYGGQSSVDEELGEWVAADNDFYFYDTEAGKWAPDTASLGRLVPDEPRKPIFGDGEDEVLGGLLFALIAAFAFVGLLAAWRQAHKSRRDDYNYRSFRDDSRAQILTVNNTPGQFMSNEDVYNAPRASESESTAPNMAAVAGVGAGVAAANPVGRSIEPHDKHYSWQGTPGTRTPQRHESIKRNSMGSTARKGKRYRVMWSHNPQQPDELDADAGDIVEEKRAFADGWVMVSDVSKGKTGMIPRNLLSEVESDQQPQQAPSGNLI